MRRGESIFELDLNAHEEVERGFELEGSNLSGVSARCSWVEQDPSRLDIAYLKEKTDEHEDGKVKSPFHQTLQGINLQVYSCGLSSQLNKSLGNRGILESAELLHIKKLEGVHLIFNLEAGSLLPLAIRYVGL